MNTAERIYVASTCEEGPEARLTEELARRIEDDIASLGLAPGASLGSLRELSERYRVGRSVVREAVGLLERRGLGRLRPGPCGGFILARPSAGTIGRSLAEYFMACRITSAQCEDAQQAITLIDAQGVPDPVTPLLRQCLAEIQALRDGPGDWCAADHAARLAQAGTRPTDIARQLAAEIRRTRGAGTRLGSEWDLCERFQVSRLTLRQAIRLLQDSGLVECRRGRGNGLIVRDRSASGSIRLVLAYLIGEQLDPMVAGTLLFQLNAHVPALAVLRADAAQRRQLEAALSRLQGCESIDRYDLLGLVHCVARVADSPVIDLFSRCLAAYEARFRPSLAVTLPAAAQAAYFSMVRRLLEQAPAAGPDAVARAHRASADCMLQMSRQRPI